MSDQDKTKEQLIEELKDMRLKMAEFEAVQKLLSEKESQSQYREIVDEASQAIFVIQDGRIKFVNKATTELTGYSKDDRGRNSRLNPAAPPSEPCKRISRTRLSGWWFTSGRIDKRRHG
ncbi:MAG: PAS domain S-box protein, partial [Desulfomonilaceae bacterium]